MSLRLPPPPPVGGGTTGRTVIDVLAEQHAGLLRLCERLTDGADPDRGRTAQVLVADLSRHLSGEEQYVYPAVRRAVPDGALLADRELAEDRAALVLLRRLHRASPGARPQRANPGGALFHRTNPGGALFHRASPGRDGFDRAAAAVVDAVRRHVAADAADLLPRLRRSIPAEDLVRLANRLQTAQEAAPTRPHPATPSTPPWNRLVDPVLALADQARDAITGRATYLRDLEQKTDAQWRTDREK